MESIYGFYSHVRKLFIFHFYGSQPLCYKETQLQNFTFLKALHAATSQRDTNSVNYRLICWCLPNIFKMRLKHKIRIITCNNIRYWYMNNMLIK